jgi:hypothetical protein
MEKKKRVVVEEEGGCRPPPPPPLGCQLSLISCLYCFHRHLQSFFTDRGGDGGGGGGGGSSSGGAATPLRPKAKEPTISVKLGGGQLSVRYVLVCSGVAWGRRDGTLISIDRSWPVTCLAVLLLLRPSRPARTGRLAGWTPSSGSLGSGTSTTARGRKHEN